MTITNIHFQTATEMSYANSDQIKHKTDDLISRLKNHLRTTEKDKSLFFAKGETIYIPDLHGDFVHMILILHRHGALDKDLNLKKDFQYVFLGDFYDRAPDADAIDFWLNNQIKNKIEIYRLIGNHEMAFFERDAGGHPLIFPSQDSIKDMSNDFQIAENLLQNIASGNILAAYVDDCRDAVNRVSTTLYVHSYVICEDFIQLGLDKNANLIDFAIQLNKRFKNHGEIAYKTFSDCKKKNKYDWKEIIKPFSNDPLFNIYTKKDDISTSFLWRRTGLSTLNIFPIEFDVEIPENIYQIVGHTPIFSFDLPKEQLINKPFIVNAKNGTGKVQFSDVGIGYYYKSDFERPEVELKITS